ncbi:MAG: outer membrane protein assembly factor BamB [Burkholderiales bacterium]
MNARSFPTRRALARTAVVAAVAAALGGCSTIYQYLPVPPSFSLRSLWGSSKKPGPLPELKASAQASVAWSASIGKGIPGFTPMAVGDAVYAASTDGNVTRLDAQTGRSVWRTSAGKTLAGGVGADEGIAVVGTDKGEVLAFDAGSGQPKWTSRVATEVVAPPRVAENVAAVFAGDGSITALAAADGSKKWVNQRTAPSLTVRNYAGGTSTRGALFYGTAGGRLLALDMNTGIVGWDATVANPKGATELERIADVTSRPVVDGQQVCAVAYQGRMACFDVARGSLNWSRDVSSLAGLAADGKYVYVTDDKGAVHALDRSTGASVWKQDLLAARKITGPVVVGDYVGVVDIEGYLHLLAISNGAYVGRMATDGTAPTSQPVQLGMRALWQSEGGNLYAVGAQ